MFLGAVRAGLGLVMPGPDEWAGIMPRSPDRSGSHRRERRGWRMWPLARSRNIDSMRGMHSVMGRWVAMVCLSMYGGAKIAEFSVNFVFTIYYETDYTAVLYDCFFYDRSACDGFAACGDA